MKRTAYTILAALAAFASLWACQDRLVPEAGDTVEKDCIVLRLGSSPLSVETRSGSERGINYNENLIESVDLFFYPNGAADGNAVLSALGRGVQAKTEADSTIYYVSIHYTASQAAALFGSTTGGTCQVYVIANANLSYGSDTKIETLKSMVLERDFTMAEVQNNFVMSSDGTATVTQALDSSGDPYATGRVKMKRAAAKAQLFLRFPESIPDESDNNRVWKPDLDGSHHSSGVTVGLTNISKKGRVDADYTVQEADYTDYEGWKAVVRTSLPGFYPAIDADYDAYTYATTPFYSYPISWSDIDERECAYIITVPWYPVDYNPSTGTSTEGDRSESRKYQVSANVVGLKMERNYCYRTFVYIQSLGGVDIEHTEVIPECDYYICPWISEGSGTGNGVVFGSFSDYKYLVIDQPELVLNNEETAAFTYISSSKVSSVTIDKIVYYDNNEVTPKQELTSGTAFTTAKGKITIDYSDFGVVTMKHKLDDALGRYTQWEVWATITNADGISESVHFVQNPPIRLERSSIAGDVFVDGWFGRVMTVPGTNASFYVQNTNDNYANGSYRSKYSTTTETNTKNNLSYVTSPYGIVRTMYGTTQTYDGIYYTTEVSISGFNTGNNTFTSSQGSSVEYVIADPRCKASEYDASFSLANYLYDSGSGDGSFAAWSSPEDIMIGVTDPAESNRIAPRFLVSSSLNSVAGGGSTQPTYEEAVKRAATYQEAGYPAGRWRLPTEAEVRFMQKMQNDGYIPTLFGTTTNYWCSDGYLIKGDATPTLAASGATAAIRFVYDLWYWGDTASTTNVYHPNGHIYDYDASGAATAR